jgi:hypothetical protein
MSKSEVIKEVERRFILKDKYPKIIQLLARAKSEWKEYERTKMFPNLSQACEKTWVAFLLALEHISGHEIKGFRDRENLSKIYNRESLLNRTAKLHMIHYEGSPDLTDEEIKYNLVLAWTDIESMISVKTSGAGNIKVKGYIRNY